LLLGGVVIATGCERRQPADEHIQVVMKKYSIEPAVIRVKAGERIELNLSTSDVQHGLDIPALGIKEPVQPGRITRVYFTAPSKGEYKMVCGVICGPHHEDMVGKLVVE
jgi:heme/copper-type cytochrome/quinol oxidase subunit 2